MLTKNNKLRKNHQFQKVIESSNQIVSSHVVLYYLKNNVGEPRYGISISKKFVNAVGRNRIRRHVREILRGINWDSFSYDLVLIIRKPLVKADHDTYIKEIENIIRKFQKGKK